MDKIIWQLGADSSQVQTEMAKAARSGQQGATAVAGSFDKVEASHERLLRSSHRVAAQIHSVTREFASGASAGDIFSASLEGIGRSLNISLGALAGLAIGAVIAQKIAAVREEYHKLQKELESVHEEASRGGDFKTLALIETQAKRAEEAVKKLSDSMDARGGKQGFWSKIGQSFVDTFNNPLGNIPVGTGKLSSQKDAEDRGRAYGDIDTLSGQATSKRQQQSDLREAALGGTPESAIKAAQALITAQEKAATTLDEVAQNFREASITLQEIVKARNDKAMERSGMSLKEMANALPDVVNNSVSYEKWKASRDAKRAMGLDAQGEAARMNMEPEAAHNLFNQAGEAKEGITGLKPSEKMSADFKGALKVTEDELRQIAENTKGRMTNR